MSEYVTKDISLQRLSAMLTTAIGPQISNLLKEDDVTDIIANSNGTLFVERIGQSKELCGTLSDDARMTVIKLVAGSVRAECNRENPSISAELLLDGSRFQGGIPPISPGPFFCIRRKALKFITLDQYVELGFWTQIQMRRISKYILENKSMLIIGSTGTGKTTFLNSLLDFIGDTKERIVIIQDTQELECRAKDVEFLFSTKNHPMDLCLQDSLRMYPDRIIVGEIRGVEAMTFVDAINTGHSGIATIHSSSAKKGLKRIERLVRRVINSPEQESIADGIEVVIYLKKEKIGKKVVRKVKEIWEIQGFDQDYIIKDVTNQ